MKKYLRFFPVIIWMSVIFYFSSRSTAGVPVYGFDRFLLFKTFHLLEYAILYLCFFYATKAGGRSVILSYLYGLTDEFHQSLTPGRTPKFTDTLFDLLGIILGYLLISCLQNSPRVRRFFS